MQQKSIVALADDVLKVIEQTTENNNKKYVEDKLYASYNSDHYKFV